MKKETRDRLLRAHDEAFRVLGFETYPAALRYIVHEMETKLSVLRPVRNRPALEALFTKAPEPPPEQLDAMVKAIQIMPYTLRKVLPEAAKELPHHPGGREKLVKTKEYPQICKGIGILVGQGVDLKDAQLCAAQRRGVSLRTIQRIWQQRKRPS